MDSVLSMINEYRIIVGAILTTLVLVVVIKLWWQEVSLFILNVYYRFPLIGKLSQLTRDYTGKETVGLNKEIWFKSEETLCRDYFKHYESVDKDGEHFEKCATYLQKVNETGRNNLHLLGWILIAALVFVEAMGFSYVLSGFTIPGASEDLQQTGALGIAFIVSVLLVGLTHFSGHELHYNHLIKKVRARWMENAVDGEKLESDNRIDLDKNIDDDQPQWKWMLNRLDHNSTVTPKYTLTIVAVILILLVAVFATYVRGQVLEKESADAHIIKDSSSYSVSNDPYGEVLPSELTDIASDSNAQAEEQSEASYKNAGWATFIILAVIFIFIQIFGIIIGYKTGFAGKHSSDARKDMGRFKTRDSFEKFYARKKTSVSRTADANLKLLQAGLARNIAAKSKGKMNLTQVIWIIKPKLKHQSRWKSEFEMNTKIKKH